jgi:uncharacterized protein (TIGR00299 family) protein
MSRRHIHLDVVGGIAGDMFVAALTDAMPELRRRVLDDVAAVLPPAAGTPQFTAGASAGLTVLRFGLEGHRHEAGHHHHDGSGSYRHMVELIRAAPLAEGTADHAVAILTILGEAEALIHGVPLGDVHFHEIGDWDSLMDVVASGSIIAALDATWSMSDLPLGGGRVRTAHGMLPVPAPATARILDGFDWRDDGVGGERVTPTGAAILRHLVAGSTRGGGRLTGTGMGAGTHDLPGMPNILRALVFEVATVGADAQTVAVLCFDIDDMTGEEFGIAADRLRAADGVLDVALASLSGKKGRPLTEFRLLVRPEALEAVQRLCFIETSTIGLRWRVEQRSTLERSTGLSASDIRVKRVNRPGGATTAKAESDDLTSIESLAGRRAAKSEAER